MRIFVLPSLLALAVCAGPAAAQHTGDIVLAVQSGRIVTGSGTPSLGTFTPARQFDVTLGATGVPFFNNNPGYDCEPGTFGGFAPVGFTIADRLWFWTGTTFAPTAGEVMQINAGSTVRVSADGPVAGFTINAGSTGEWHVHLGMTLQRGVAPAITQGVYLLPMELSSGVLQRTPTFYLLLRSSASQDATAAREFVRTRILPPGRAGDADGDGVVGFTDLNLVLSDYGATGRWLRGDVNRDGVVDFLDLNIVLSAYGAQ